MFNSLSDIEKKASFIWIMAFFCKKINSVGHIQKKDLIWFDFDDDSHQRDARHLSLTDNSRAAETAHKVCTVFSELHFPLWVKQEQMSKVLFSTPIAFNNVIHQRDTMPTVEQNAQKDRKPYTEETQADNPYHNEAFPESKMPKKAHRPPNIPACKLSSAHHRSPPNSKKTKKAQPNIHTSRRTHQNFPRALLSQESSISQATVSRCCCASAETDGMIMYGTARQDCSSLLSCQDTLWRPAFKVTTGQNIHGTSQPFRSPFRESQHMLSTETQKTTSTKQ